MSSKENLPADGVLEAEQTTHDEFVHPEYTTTLYRQEHTRRAVYIDRIIDERNVREYNVYHPGRDGDLGTAADLETANGIAFAFTNDSVASA